MQGADFPTILNELAIPRRFAAAYAPRGAKPLWVGLLALDARLARTAQSASEPQLAQIKLAWWRDRLAEAPEFRPKGEPLLALLGQWRGEDAALSDLVDAWERTVGEPDAPQAVAAARAGAIAALARLVGARVELDAIALAVRRWTLSEMRRELPPGGGMPRLPRALRPLSVLAAMEDGAAHGPWAFARLVRLGLLGR